MTTETYEFRVRIKSPYAFKKYDARDYVNEAVSSWCGQFNPESEWFNIGDNVTTVLAHNPWQELRRALRRDKDYARSWAANIACCIMDADERFQSDKPGRDAIARRIMKHCFDVDIEGGF